MAEASAAAGAATARDWGRLAAAVAEQVLARPVEELHRAVSSRVFRALGPVGAPARLAHDTVSTGVHLAVRAGIRGAGAVGGLVAAARTPADAEPWHERSPAGSKLAAVAHGLFDRTPQVAPSLDLEMCVREAGRTVPLRPDAVGEAYPDATGRVTVLLHGLVEDETIWDPAPDRPDGRSLPAALRALGITPVRVRFGTGRAIARNGAALADLLHALLDAWPRPVEQLTLIGHSMGGLVIRAACVTAVERGDRWLEPLEHAAYLGAPHLGAPLEQLVHRSVRRLGHVPELAPLLGILEQRSRGVRDLRHGTIVDDQTRVTARAVDTDSEVDARARQPLPDHPWLDGVDHHLVVGRLVRADRHPVNRLFGDLLVTHPSATGRGRRRRIEGERVHVLPVSANHFGICWHPEVVDHLTGHLGGARR